MGTQLPEVDSLIAKYNLNKHEVFDEITLIVPRELILQVLAELKIDAAYAFDSLIDVCGIDYLDYGFADWQAASATHSGFSRAANRQDKVDTKYQHPERFAVVYHLLSRKLNHRLRVRVYLSEADVTIASAYGIWPAADWFEREAFDMFGIVFIDHPDLRRILTDYGFKGHPFRKDFPLIGEVEMRYDATQQRCVYEPVSIQARVIVPKVIRRDQRYSSEVEENT
jgi:NADH-quinone oxidoreductase subunit C